MVGVAEPATYAAGGDELANGSESSLKVCCGSLTEQMVEPWRQMVKCMLPSRMLLLDFSFSS